MRTTVNLPHGAALSPDRSEVEGVSDYDHRRTGATSPIRERPAMQAIQFEAKIDDGVIQVPARHRAWRGRNVKVILLVEDDAERPVTPRSALDILAQTSGQRLFQTAEEVDQHLRTERDQWDA